MICGGMSLVGVTGTSAEIHALRCKRWVCPTCGPRKVRATIARVRKGMATGGTVRFFTLTSPGTEDGPTSYEELPHRWKVFILRVTRRFGHIEYLAVVEPQRRGAAHLHVVYRGPYIPQRWLSQAAADAGFGPIADIRKAPRTIAPYLAKYLGKELANPNVKLPKYFRRVRWSHGWCDWQRPQREDRPEAWWLVYGLPGETAVSAARRGLRVVAVTGDGWPGALSLRRPLRWQRLGRPAPAAVVAQPA
jgi:hypothetical protein